MNIYCQIVSPLRCLSDLKPICCIFRSIGSNFQVCRLAPAAASFFVVLLVFLVFALPKTVLAKFESEILQQCRNLSLADDDIHNCLDNHLDLMDENLSDLLDFIRRELESSLDNTQALNALDRSQQAFETYRTENCLWYLEFSSPRNIAEQIAKNCLATMSEDRLAELQRLVKTANPQPQQSGYYVFGPDRNTFTPCGAQSRLWVEGESTVINELQQSYLNEATSDLQLVYVELIGEVDSSAVTSALGHDGVFNIQGLKLLRAPTDIDCAPPQLDRDGGPESTDNLANDVSPDTTIASSVSDNDDSNQAALEPEQTLTAYFGEWIAVCEQLGSSYGCALSAPLVNLNAGETAEVAEIGANTLINGGAALRITRRSKERTIVDVDFPLALGSTVTDVSQIHWTVDSFDLGKILHSQLHDIAGVGVLSGETLVRQSLRERWFIRDELLPMLLEGRNLNLSVLSESNVEHDLSATLNGLTRALNFADDFTSSEGAF